MSDVERVAEAMYRHQTDNHPTIHCNRFPAWSEIPDEKRQNIRDMATAAIAAIVPEGSVVVPREATETMRLSAYMKMIECSEDGAVEPNPYDMGTIYTAMIKASEDT